jgi:hypothetical protein
MFSIPCLLLLALFMFGYALEPPVSAQTRGRSVNANRYPGADLGAKINAADQDLGTASGEIVVSGGGTISTQVILSSGHTLRLGKGTYHTRTTSIPILMKARTSIVGSGWDAIVMESTAPGQLTVISAYNQSIRNGSPDSDLLIRDIQVQGANSKFNSAPQAISLGNCANCTVDRVWVNGTHSIGIQLGGSGRDGHFARNSKVINCQFTRVASQNLALVNGRDILFEGNKFLASGQKGGPGSSNIDLEVNEGSDHLENVIIRNNYIDVRGSEISPTGNGIIVQASSGTPYVGNILIERNTIIGGSNTGVITNVLSNGIYVFGTTMRDVIIRGNSITRTGQAGINIQGSNLTVVDNLLTDVGGGGTPGFLVQGVTRSRIVNNRVSYTDVGPFDGRMLITHGSRDNVIQGNTNWVVTNAN